MNDKDEIIREINKAICIIIIVLIAVLLLVGVYFISFSKDNSKEFITALEFKEEADIIALDWSEDATLNRISSAYNDIRDDGTCVAWEYNYHSPSSLKIENNQELYQVICITLEESGKGVIKYEDWRIYTQAPEPNNLTEHQLDLVNKELILNMDSDEAFQIAFSDFDIQSVSQKGGAIIYANSQADWSSQGWDVQVSAGFGDITHYYARVFINGETGEIEFKDS